MRIAFVSLFREDLGGGGGKLPQEMAQRFAEQHEVVMIWPGDKTGPGRAACGLRTFTLKSVGEGDMYVPLLSLRDINRLCRFLDTFNPDVVHVHSPISACLMVQVWAKRRGVPFLATVHILPTRALDVYDDLKAFKGPLKLLFQPGLARFYADCDAIIAPNGFAAEDVVQIGGTGRIFIVPNARDLGKYRVFQSTDLASPERVLLFVGYLNERKNQQYLLEVLRRLPENYQLHLVGGGLALTSEYGQRLEAFAEEHGLNVLFVGQVEQHDIPVHLAKAHVFVSASTLEVQSLVVIEALASGTPVVGLSNETIDELVDEQVGCRLPQGTDPEAFAYCVERVCNLPQTEYEEMCGRARDRVERFDWPNIMALTVAAYEALLAEGDGASQPCSSAAAAAPPIGRRLSRAGWFFFFLTLLLSPVCYLIALICVFVRRFSRSDREVSLSWVTGRSG